jgi:hypothetical protein
MPEYLGTSLPQDLRDATEDQHNEVITYLVTLPLKELRQRQSLVRDQREMANAEIQRHGESTRLERALSDLEIMDAHLFRAVFLQSFGEDPGWPIGSQFRTLTTKEQQ